MYLLLELLEVAFTKHSELNGLTKVLIWIVFVPFMIVLVTVTYLGFPSWSFHALYETLKGSFVVLGSLFDLFLLGLLFGLPFFLVVWLVNRFFKG